MNTAQIGAFVLYIVWTALTYWLERRQRTFLRPEAARLRVVYAVVANLLVGIVVAGWWLNTQDDVTPGDAGFQSLPHALIAVLAGAALGLIFYMAQRPPTRHPTIMLNGFAQVWTVSAAEVVICWSVVGSTVEELTGSPVVAALVASLLFGLYHVGHSAPFNSPKMIAALSVIGLFTSVFFFVSRDVYGTIVFHNFFAMTGVLRALNGVGALDSFRRLLWPLLITALISLGLLIAVHVAWLGV